MEKDKSLFSADFLLFAVILLTGVMVAIAIAKPQEVAHMFGF